MKKYNIRKITYRLLALSLVATTLWTSSIVSSYANPDESVAEEPICGIMAHTHTQTECYTQTKSLVCELEEDSSHTHVGTCYSYDNELVCKVTECEAHTHDDGCYTVEAACGQEEGAEHAHEESCYTGEKKLTCSKTETAGHTHGESCYEMQTTLVCAVHIHDENCYLVESKLTCQQAEHIHSEACYDLCTCNPVDGVHQEGCVLYEEVCTCDPAPAEGEAHGEGCVFYVPVQQCEYCGVELVEDAVHAEDCLTRCTCTPIDDVHQEGCALYKKPELTQRVISSGNISVSGALPEAAQLVVASPTAEVLPVLPVEENDQIVFAYDISILVDGADYQPEGAVEVTVPLQADLPESTDWTLSVLHITDTGAIEKVSAQLNTDGTVSFLASGFSTYVGTITVADNKTTGKIGDYIYFDLAAGNITINNSTYTGYIYKDGTTVVTVTGTHSSANKYYVYQSTEENRDETGLLGEEFYLPKYDRVSFDGDTWGDYITNNTSPTEVATNWEPSAVSVARTPTDNSLTFSGAGTYNVIIDNLWSTKYDGVKTRITGGISYVASTGGKLLINLIGDNRFGNIHYSYGGTKNNSTVADANGYVNGTGIVFQNAETTTLPGSLTVVSYNGKSNHYCSVIGGNDDGSSAHEWSCGIVINSGVIYAGARVDGTYTGSYQVDNCSAIGGGGNGTGVVTIKGGKVTAVVSSTGAAIGGGIGESSYGGEGYVAITGGEVYAYNFGYVTFGGGKPYPVPAAAIGGASSRDNAGNTGKVTITGGEIYALSVGGAAIGGGSSTKNNGGVADVYIGGSANITALSIAGTVNGISVDAGVSIGGGTGGSLGSGSGGNATLKIENGTIKTGSIGGGACTNASGKIGYAEVEISGGTTQGQVIMAAGAKVACKFTMTGGLLDNSSKTSNFIFLKQDGGAVYMDDPIGEAVVSGGTIRNCSAQNGGAVYMTAGTFTLSGNGKIEGCTASAAGGAVYLGKKGEHSGTFAMFGGSIVGNSAANGGAAYLDGGTMTVSGGSVTKNTASANGGGAYLAGGSMTVSGGSIGSSGAANSAQNGGGAYLNGGTLTVSGGSIAFNTATSNGGGAYLNGGTLTISGGSIASNTATNNGGGAYLNGGTLTISGGSIASNTAANNGGGAYISGGDFNLNGEYASVEKNKAQNGAGVYLTGGKPNLLQGVMKNNTASVNGGGIYIDKQQVLLKPTGVVTISGNKAEGNGAGIYIGGTTGTDASFAVDSSVGGQVHLTGNGTAATDNGGAVCISNGQFTMDADNITITGNQATNGGGVAVLSGNFSMSAGSIGASGAANLATNGGGVFVDGGTATVSGGTVQYNKAVNGGGVGVSGGDFVMTNGAVHNNAAASNGGGVYVSGGDFQMEGGTIGGASASAANTAKNGGGVYVADGNVTVIDGAIDCNQATINGGGMFVSSDKTEVQVIMLSGSLSHNTAAANGGGMAVESTSGQTVTVEIGCLLDHKITSGSATLPIDYTGTYDTYAPDPHKHNTCPVVQSNVGSGIGGGFYLNSDNCTLKFYCVIETDNQAADGKENCWGMDVEGGKVIIGDSQYHNSGVDGEGRTKPYGYVQMSSAILVNGGQVDIYGDMDNPHFEEDITVDITQTGDYYIDHRRSDSEFKIHYVEDFLDPVTGVRTGEYIARQYNAEEAKNVTIDGALFIREGYEIKGWYTGPNGTREKYEVGRVYDLTNPEESPDIGITKSDCTICGEAHIDAKLLKLYAYWAANGFEVVFDPNVPIGTNFGVKMPNQTFTYGSDVALRKNTYVYPGYIFTGWNTKADGSGTPYYDQAVGGKITNQNGVTITLYAQWKKCTHNAETSECFFTYSVDSTGAVLRRSCSCGGQDLEVGLVAEDVIYNGSAHPVFAYYEDKTTWNPALVYTKDGASFSGDPINAGTYRASVTDGGKTAYVEYEILKAPQAPPAAPGFGVSSNVLTVDHVPASSKETIDSGIETYYQLYYYSGGVLHEGNINNTGVFTLDQAYTNYYVMVWYGEGFNHNASEKVRSQQTHFHKGDTTIEFKVDDGILFSASENTDAGGLTITVEAADGYYLTSDFAVSENHDAANGAEITTVKEREEYVLKDVPNTEGLVITVTITGVKKKTVITGAVAEKQVFGTVVNDENTVISRDSAFTAYYTVSNYDNTVYSNMRLSFGDDTLPAGATIILQNKADNSYWGYTASGGEGSVSLKAFTRMGDTGEFDVVGTELAYQFIVDFSRSAGGDVADWTMSLVADKETDSMAPDFVGQVHVTLVAEAAFEVQQGAATTSVPELTQNLELNYTASDGAASKWDGRHAALVLSPVTGDGQAIAPPDTKVSVTVAQTTTVYPMSAGGKFVIPLSELQTSTSAEIVLQSALLPATGETYAFTAEWIVSNTKAERSPLNGEEVAELSLTFVKTASVEPSMKIDGRARLLTNEQLLEVTMSYRNMKGYTIEAEVLKRFDTVSESGASSSQYSGIGKGIDISRNNDDADGTATHELDISLNGLGSGSYCVMVTVKNGILKVMEVPYYFIVQ